MISAGSIKTMIVITALSQAVAAASLPDTMLANIWNFSLARLRATMTALGNSTTQFPRSASKTSGTWGTVGASDWTSGFYPGCLWYAYEKSGDTMFRYNARRWTASLAGQAGNTTTHDVGFMIFCSYGNGYRLLGTASYLSTILTAARSLTTRFRPNAGIIDSWSWAPYDTGWEAIIDNMMNLELLFWASQNGSGRTYYDTALSHAEKTMANHFRADSSTYHVVRYSRLNGTVISRETRQGYASWSCWARGQAWGIYGFTMTYRFTRDPRFLVRARGAADYFIRRLPADRVPYWDFDAPGIPADTVPRDVASAAIVASALLELSTLTGAPDSVRYRDTAISILKGLWTTKYRGLTTQASILNHATGDRPRNSEVDLGLIYADYYFLEALLRYERYSKSTGIISPYVNFTGTAASPLLPEWPFDLLGRKGSARAAAPGVYIVRLPAGYGTAVPYLSSVAGPFRK